MTLNELERFKQIMHHHVIITKNDGSTVEGYIQPWSQTTVYLSPLGDATGEAIKVAIFDIQRIDPQE
jgi:hypothetical protein